MRRDVDTRHGLVQISVKTGVNPFRAFVEWGHPGPVSRLEYVVGNPFTIDQAKHVEDDALAAVVAEHFDRTERPGTDTLHFNLIDLVPSGKLELVPIS